MADNAEVRAFNERAFEFLRDYPIGIPATQLVSHVDTGGSDEALFAIGLLQVWLDDHRTARVFEARATGRSWGWIGARLGASRQAVWDRYRDRDELDPEH